MFPAIHWQKPSLAGESSQIFAWWVIPHPNSEHDVKTWCKPNKSKSESSESFLGLSNMQIANYAKNAHFHPGNHRSGQRRTIMRLGNHRKSRGKMVSECDFTILHMGSFEGIHSWVMVKLMKKSRKMNSRVSGLLSWGWPNLKAIWVSHAVCSASRLDWLGASGKCNHQVGTTWTNLGYSQPGDSQPMEYPFVAGSPWLFQSNAQCGPPSDKCIYRPHQHPSTIVASIINHHSYCSCKPTRTPPCTTCSDHIPSRSPCSMTPPTLPPRFLSSFHVPTVTSPIKHGIFSYGPWWIPMKNQWIWWPSPDCGYTNWSPVGQSVDVEARLPVGLPCFREPLEL